MFTTTMTYSELPIVESDSRLVPIEHKGVRYLIEDFVISRRVARPYRNANDLLRDATFAFGPDGKLIKSRYGTV